MIRPRPMDTGSELILASASPRRAQLLRDCGFVFRVVTPPFDEPDHLPGVTDPAALAEQLSRLKAEHARPLVSAGVILAGDTVAALQGEVFGKPRDRDDARRIISSLAGTTHQVITGITLLDAASGRSATAHAVTDVTMRLLSDSELDEYLDSGDWAGKAGAYGIQDHGDRFVTSIDGSFSNVVGLPLELATALLADWGIRPGHQCPDR